MKNLINFLIKYSVVFLFIVLEIISFSLIIQNRDYQRSVFLSSSNILGSGILQAGSYLSDFFKLRSINDALVDENISLKNQVVDLQKQLAISTEQTIDTVFNDSHPELDYQLISAKVISNSTNKIQNYITINKGKKDGLKPDMGVINEDGVVGIVKTVGNRFSTVIPILNPMSQISAKLKRNNYSASVLWDADDYRFAQLIDVARHVTVERGDTVISSGLTRTFPEGFVIGTIEDFNLNESDLYIDIDLRLSVDFRTLSYVQVIDYLHYEEQTELEKASQK